MASPLDTVLQYSFHCQEEAKTIYTWDIEPPTRCVHDASHNIDPSSVTLIPDSEIEFFRLFEEGVLVEQRYICEGMYVPIPALASQVYNLYWPFPMAVHSTEFVTTADHVGDIMFHEIAPNTPLCYVQETVPVGSNCVKVLPKTLAYMRPGHILHFWDRATNVTEDLGYITRIDQKNCTIWFEHPTTQGASTSMIVQMTLQPLCNYRIQDTGTHYRGRKSTSGLYMPANTRSKLTYMNSSQAAKAMQFYFQYTI